MEIKTYIKNVKTSPKKLRFFLPEIKRLGPTRSLDYLFYTNKKAARILYKAIKSAINNAKQKGLVDLNALSFKLLTVEQGRVLKRYKAGSKGMAKPIKKRYSHIKIILNLKQEEKNKDKLIDLKKEIKKTNENKIVTKKLTVKKQKTKKLKSK